MDTKNIHKYLGDQNLWLEVQYWAGMMHDHEHQYEIAEEIVAAINHYKDNKPVIDLINEILEMSDGHTENLHIKGDWLVSRLKELI